MKDNSEVKTLPGELDVTRAWLDESVNECTMCGACEATCPEVFEVPEKMIVVEKPGYNLKEAIEEAADGCPVGTIAIEYNNSGKRGND